jgi:uncharacterized membrane protein
MVLKDYFIHFILENRGKILGGLLGLIVAVLFAIFGFWKGLFIIVCIILGVFLGSLVENDGKLQGFFDRLWRRQDRY